MARCRAPCASRPAYHAWAAREPTEKTAADRPLPERAAASGDDPTTGSGAPAPHRQRLAVHQRRRSAERSATTSTASTTTDGGTPLWDTSAPSTMRAPTGRKKRGPHETLPFRAVAKVPGGPSRSLRLALAEARLDLRKWSVKTVQGGREGAGGPGLLSAQRGSLRSRPGLRRSSCSSRSDDPRHPPWSRPRPSTETRNR
jgi:hypothetical protein